MLGRSTVLAWAAVVVVVWALAVVIGKVGVPVRPEVAFPRTPVETLSTFDGVQYEWLARHGYSNEGAEQRRFAFFPLLPLLARALGGEGHPALAGILLNQLMLLASVLLLNAAAGIDKATPWQQQPGFWLLVSPVAFFLSVFYAESGFLLLSMLLFAMFRKGHYAAAAIAGFLAGLMRPTAICLPALLLVDTFRSYRLGQNRLASSICLLSPLLGVASYLGFVAWQTGDPMGYVHIQNYWHGTGRTLPFRTLGPDLLDALTHLAQDDIRPADQWVRLLSSFAVIGLLLWGWRRIDPGLLCYVVAALLFIHSQQPDTRTPRYELVLFPVFLLVAQAATPRPRTAAVVAASLVVMQLILFYMHATWQWVA